MAPYTLEVISHGTFFFSTKRRMLYLFHFLSPADKTEKKGIQEEEGKNMKKKCGKQK